MNKGLITVVIPAYKCENVISSAIESVLCQTYNNYELIVVDDGSPDNTVEVIKKYQDRLTYIFQENGGVSKARNTGIKYSNGEYIAFLDADDRWDNNKLELQMELFNRHPEVNMVFSGFWNTTNGIILKNKSYKDAFNFFKEYGYDAEDIFKSKLSFDIKGKSIEYYFGNIYEYLFLGNFILPSSVILKKQSLIRTGLFNEKFRVAEETDYFLKFSKQNVIGFVNCPLVYYESPCSENLSGKSNMESLMKNALKIQIDSFVSNFNLTNNRAIHYYKGISKTYGRLAYYYLSEYKFLESRKYATYSIKLDYYNPISYLILLGSYTPKIILKYIAIIKERMHKN